MVDDPDCGRRGGNCVCAQAIECRHARGERDMAAIKGREAVVRDSIRRGEREVDLGPFNYGQLRLSPVVADEFGKLWRVEGARLVLLSGPRRAR